ncbi:hypothetical protein Q7P37_003278 [Cladosporium fusiforme]
MAHERPNTASEQTKIDANQESEQSDPAAVQDTHEKQAEELSSDIAPNGPGHRYADNIATGSSRAHYGDNYDMFSILESKPSRRSKSPTRRYIPDGHQKARYRNGQAVTLLTATTHKGTEWSAGKQYKVENSRTSDMTWEYGLTALDAEPGGDTPWVKEDDLLIFEDKFQVLRPVTHQQAAVLSSFGSACDIGCFVLHVGTAESQPSHDGGLYQDEALMPDGSLALSIPGLFLTCVQYFTLIRLGRDFEADFGSCILKLRTVELRLQRWGTSVGITNEAANEFEKLEERDDSGDIEFALKQISKQLSRAHEDSEAIVNRNRDPKVLDVIDEVQQLELSDAKISRASRVQAKLKFGYQKSFDLTSRVVVRTQWALYKKTHLTNLLDVVSEHVAQLETLFPAPGADLAAAEAKDKDMNPEVMKTLKPIAEELDPLLSHALQAEAGRQGVIFENLEATDNARVQWGSNYTSVPQNEGLTVYRGIRSGGNSISQAGNNYGFSSLPVYNNQGSNVVAPAPKPDAQPGNGVR